MKLYLCTSAGCYTLVDKPGTFCPAHQSQQAEKDARIKARMASASTATWDRYHAANPEQTQVWRSYRWRKLKAGHLKREPLCRICGAVATSVDHIIGHKGDPVFAYNPDNLQSLCNACHGRKTRSERIRV
jgi:5-methylcytosine-specific restriction protein A